MSWRQLKVQVSSEQAEAIEVLLIELGAEAVTLQDAGDQSIFQNVPGETPLWDQSVLTALFRMDLSVNSLLDTLRQQLGSQIVGEPLVEVLQDSDWERAWMADFKPMRFGDRLWICPSWADPPEPDAVNILLDPGLAFGTGTHATTALCLEWLEGQALSRCRVIDFGCGSGVLAIAAALLGAAQVRAVDNDPQALAATATNRDNNAVSSSVLQVCSPETLPPEPGDVLVANILAGALTELAPLFAQLLQPGGRLVLSGVLPSQEEELNRVYRQWFTMAQATERDGWLRMEGVRD
ncbi:MAG: 50S ribosomal protein L11 methyltransferase [Pseudohongiellaceae bacterium]